MIYSIGTLSVINDIEREPIHVMIDAQIDTLETSAHTRKRNGRTQLQAEWEPKFDKTKTYVRYTENKQ